MLHTVPFRPAPASGDEDPDLINAGKEPVTLPTGETRTFLEDGDEVTLRAVAKADGHVPIGFGPCSAVIMPAP